jgi:ABC-type iron transport system FetAB ATPase subunit
MDIAAGQCVSFSGPSGAGKSILLKAIIDLIPNQGELSFNSHKRQDMRASDWRKLVGLLPAESFWWCSRVGQHFPQLNEQQLGWFRTLGFEQEVLDWELSRCSTGERQRLALLRLLCHAPKVLLLDEPTANLDKVNTEKVEKIIMDYRDQYQCPVIWVSHDQQQIRRLADVHYLLEEDGQLQKVAA